MNQKLIEILIQAKDDASATLARVGTSVGALDDKQKDMINTASKGIAVFGALGGVALAGVGIYGLYAAGGMEQANISMKNMLGNADLANHVFGQLATYANNTPFEFADIQKAANTLLGFGYGGQQAVSTIKQMGDVAAASGGNITDLALVTGQIFSQGKLRAQDLYQVINDGGAGVVKIMADNVGGMKNLTAEFDKGGIPAQQYFNAINQATSKGGFAFEGAANQAQTFNGRISTLKDAFTQLAERLVGVKVTANGLTIDPNGLFEKASNAVLGLINALNGLPAWWDKNKETIRSAVIALTGAVLGLGVAWTVMNAATIVAVAGAVVAVAPFIIVGAILATLWDKNKVAAAAFAVAVGAVVVALNAAKIAAFADDLGLVAVKFGFFVSSVADGAATIVTKLATDVAGAFTSAASSAAESATGMAVDSGKALSAWAASAAGTASAWATASARFIASSVVMGAQAISAAAKASLAWIVAAHQSEEGLVGSLIIVGAKYTWLGATAVFNAITSLGAWTITFSEMKARAIATALESAVQSTLTGIAWVRAATISGAAWTVTELPSIIRAFATTAVTGSAQAVVASIAWVRGATTSGAAWVVQSGIISGEYIAMGLASIRAGAIAVAQFTFSIARAALYAVAIDGAKLATLAWTGAQWLLNVAMDANPLGLVIIGITALVAGAALIVTHWQQVKNFFEGLWNTLVKVGKALLNFETLGQGTKILHTLGVPGFANGVQNFGGGLAVVGEKGPELVSLPAGSSVYSNRDSKKMMGGMTINQTNHIYNQVDMAAANAELGWRLATA